VGEREWFEEGLMHWVGNGKSTYFRMILA